MGASSGQLALVPAIGSFGVGDRFAHPFEDHGGVPEIL
jgi:hypothetical protein